MLAATFHSAGRNDPYAPVEIDFAPGCTKNFTWASGRQNQKLERAGSDAFLLAQGIHELADLGVGQGGMMFDLSYLRPCGQQMIEMTAPAGGIVAKSVTANLSPAQYRLNPAAQSARGLWLARPDRLQCAHDEAGIDGAYRQLAKRRRDVGIKRVAPLLPVLGVAPAVSMGSDISFGAIVEGNGLGIFDTSGSALRVAFGKWVRAFGQHLAKFKCPLARGRQADLRIRPQTHVVSSAVQGVAEDPAARSTRRNPVIQTTA